MFFHIRVDWRKAKVTALFSFDWMPLYTCLQGVICSKEQWVMIMMFISLYCTHCLLLVGACKWTNWFHLSKFLDHLTVVQRKDWQIFAPANVYFLVQANSISKMQEIVDTHTQLSWSRSLFAKTCLIKREVFPLFPLKSPLSCCVPVYMCVMCVCIIHSVFCVPEIGSPNPSSG